MLPQVSVVVTCFNTRDYIADAIRSAHQIADGDLRIARQRLPLELDPFPPIAVLEHRFERAAAERDFAAIVSLGDALVLARRVDELREAAITAIGIGSDFALVVLPGEVFLEHGLAVRAASPFRETIVAAYNDNTLQYIPTASAFPDGAYEIDGGWRYIRPGQGEFMADEAVRLLAGLAAPVSRESRGLPR